RLARLRVVGPRGRPRVDPAGAREQGGEPEKLASRVPCHSSPSWAFLSEASRGSKQESCFGLPSRDYNARREEEDVTVVRVSTRGQITLPAEARRAVGISPHDQVLIEVRDQEIVVKPA